MQGENSVAMCSNISLVFRCARFFKKGLDEKRYGHPVRKTLVNHVVLSGDVHLMGVSYRGTTSNREEYIADE